MATIHPVPAEWASRAYVDAEGYAGMYRASLEQPEAFWREQSGRIDWIKPWSQLSTCSFGETNFGIEWFYAYVTLNANEEPGDDVRKELVQWVRKEIGPIAKPDVIHFAPVLPKTRSGKIMRRILRKIAEGDVSNLGDTSTLADPAVVETLLAGGAVVLEATWWCSRRNPTEHGSGHGYPLQPDQAA